MYTLSTTTWPTIIAPTISHFRPDRKSTFRTPQTSAHSDTQTDTVRMNRRGAKVIASGRKDNITCPTHTTLVEMHTTTPMHL